MMDKSIDISVSKRVLELMAENKITRYTVIGFLHISISSFNDILSGKSPWRLEYLIKIALYFGVTTDKLLFGDNDYVKKNTKEVIYKFKQDVKDFLIREKKYKTFGELSAEGYFDILTDKQ
jgi:hypothetical protein